MQNLILSYFKPPLAWTMDVLVTKLTALTSNCRRKKEIPKITVLKR